ncbi:ribosome-associated heat shock protein Hsp15 [Dysgonomonas alginatilytica]|uniref:Ribosome-associated heat shock protein Hsp15 n=1 Tax=Dysgonomonas alginatilytica TaxID=1605892 RepID=A0A2V3PQG4_9BACT|nr:RNA-binding S4 domain-containing protein [Dysgonomonas alginatilytica]PXV64157.1 ribosome-associated heat shock protein Hsp15 [Dysgonomonas alginatilytica]
MKEEKTEVRIDKWLWAVRLFKTRTLAVEACKKGRIMIQGTNIKPSRMIRVGDVIQIKKAPITYSFKVLDLSEKRMGAKLVPLFMEDATPQSEYEILELSKVSGFIDRDRGAGRPTKKDRRDLDDFIDDSFFDEWDFDSDQD